LRSHSRFETLEVVSTAAGIRLERRSALWAQFGHRKTHPKMRQFDKSLILLVPGGGVEPPRGCPRRILSPLRLPVPPSRLWLVQLVYPGRGVAGKFGNLSPALPSVATHSRLPLITSLALAIRIALYGHLRSNSAKLTLMPSFWVGRCRQSSCGTIRCPRLRIRESENCGIPTWWTSTLCAQWATALVRRNLDP
jgi:hypothetical protein